MSACLAGLTRSLIIARSTHGHRRAASCALRCFSRSAFTRPHPHQHPCPPRCTLPAATMSTEGGAVKRVRLDSTLNNAAVASATTSTSPSAGAAPEVPYYDVNYKAVSPESLKATLGEPCLPNPLQLKVDAQDGRARACTIMLPHGPVQTPVFMPVGTKGTIKCLTSEQVRVFFPPFCSGVYAGASAC